MVVVVPLSDGRAVSDVNPAVLRSIFSRAPRRGTEVASLVKNY